jgi:hypothetical protein
MTRALPFALLLLTACVSTSGRTVVVPADAPELATASVDPVSGIWESVPFASPECLWLPYPGQVTLALEHGLGRAPREVLVYLSFDACGRGAALGAGDLFLIEEATDTRVVLRNDTNADFFARVVLR